MTTVGRSSPGPAAHLPGPSSTGTGRDGRVYPEMVGFRSVAAALGVGVLLASCVAGTASSPEPGPVQPAAQADVQPDVQPDAASSPVDSGTAGETGSDPSDGPDEGTDEAQPARAARPSGPVTMTHANLYTGMSAGDFADDLASVVAARTDFVTLNETYRRGQAALRPDGYDVYRARHPRDARETPVLWRTDRWRVVASGTTLMHDRAVRWGTRYVNWVSLKERGTGAPVSVISAHASPGGGERRGLLRVFLARLDVLTARLARRGPVLVGADLNASYQESLLVRSAFLRSRATPTFDALGEPVGGWATGDGGRTIDYILATPEVRVLGQSTHELVNSDHRMLTATLKVTAQRP